MHKFIATFLLLCVFWIAYFNASNMGRKIKTVHGQDLIFCGLSFYPNWNPFRLIVYKVYWEYKIEGCYYTFYGYSYADECTFVDKK